MTAENLIMYTPKTIKGARDVEPTIRISRKAAICISKGAKEAFGLKEGDTIALVQDKVQKEWYIIRHDEGFKLRETSNGSSLAFNSTALANTLLDSCNLKEKSYVIKVATVPAEIKQPGGSEPLQGWAILTASAKL